MPQRSLIQNLIFLYLLSFVGSVIADPFDISSYSDTNRLIWDSGFQEHIADYFGDMQANYFWPGTVAEQVKAGFGGAPDDVFSPASGVYLASACRYQSCSEKAAYVTDGKNELFAIIAYFCEVEGNDRQYLDSGCMVVFSQNKESKEALFSYLKAWKERLEKGSTIEFEMMTGPTR